MVFVFFFNLKKESKNDLASFCSRNEWTFLKKNCQYNLQSFGLVELFIDKKCKNLMIRKWYAF